MYIPSFFALLVLPVVVGYNTFDARWIADRIELHPCPNLPQRLWASAQQSVHVVSPYVNVDLVDVPEEVGKNGINTICTSDAGYGFTRLTMANHTITEADIFVHSALTGSNLDNVMLHELLHAVGLNHSENAGIMNYSVRVNGKGEIVADPLLYLSLDDVQGLKQLRKNSTRCPKVRILNLLERCW